MITIGYCTEVEIDLAYADTSSAEVHTDGGYAEYSGIVRDNGYGGVFEISAEDLVGQLCEEELEELKAELKVGANIIEMPVDSIYEAMDEGQRAHMFNKLLKHEGYNAGAVRLSKVAVLLSQIALERNV